MGRTLRLGAVALLMWRLVLGLIGCVPIRTGPVNRVGTSHLASVDPKSPEVAYYHLQRFTATRNDWVVVTMERIIRWDIRSVDDPYVTVWSGEEAAPTDSTLIGSDDNSGSGRDAYSPSTLPTASGTWFGTPRLLPTILGPALTACAR
jgi:hypothetical protein